MFYLIRMKSNVTHTVNNHLCTGCGICEDVCPKHCITIRRTRDELRPQVDETSCLGEKCGRCLKVCPGIGINLQAVAQEQFQDTEVKEDKYIGRYVALHTGYSLDEDVRYHAASGGMVSQFLIYLLDKKIIDGAVVTGFGEDHLTPVSYIARKKEEIINAISSKYCPVALNQMGNEIAASEGRYVIVGLPCHIQGFRKRMSIDKRFRERVIGLFAIYCSSERTYNAQDYLLKHYCVNKQDISYFAFRDNGCLGNLTIETKKGDRVSIPYSIFYGPVLRSFFKPHRCLSCIDHYGELADVCFGDIHIKPYSNDHIGVSSWITRSEYWEQQFRKAAAEGYIKMDDVDVETLNRSQATMLYPKKRKAKAVMNMDRLIGRATPKYDKPLGKPGLKDYISEVVCMCQQFIGRRKPLWFVIEFINRNK